MRRSGLLITGTLAVCVALLFSLQTRKATTTHVATHPKRSTSMQPFVASTSFVESAAPKDLISNGFRDNAVTKTTYVEAPEASRAIPFTARKALVPLISVACLVGPHRSTR